MRQTDWRGRNRPSSDRGRCRLLISLAPAPLPARPTQAGATDAGTGHHGAAPNGKGGSPAAAVRWATHMRLWLVWTKKISCKGGSP